MSIIEFEIGQTDSDGERRVNLEFEIINTYGEDISYVLYDAQFFDNSGNILGTIDDDSSLRLWEKGESDSFFSSAKIVNSINHDGEECFVHLQARFFTKIFAKFGPFDVPEKIGANHYKINIQDSPVGQEIGGLGNGGETVVTVSRLAPDDDGCVNINILCLLKNKSTGYSARNELKISLADRNGREIESVEQQKGLLAGNFVCFKPGFWQIKQSKLKKATFEMEISIHKQVGAVELEASSKIPM